MVMVEAQTYPRNARVPPVERGEAIDEIHQSGDFVLAVVAQDLLRRRLGREFRVGDDLLLHEARLDRLQLSAGNVRVVGSELAVELQVVTGDGVIWVVQHGVKLLAPRAELGSVGKTQVLRHAVIPVVGRVVQALAVDTPEDIVEGTVLQQDPDDVLDLALEVRNRLLGTGLVFKGRWADLGERVALGGDGVGHGRGGSQEAAESDNGSVSLHGDRSRILSFSVEECLSETVEDVHTTFPPS